MGNTVQNDPHEIRAIIQLLAERYPDAHIALWYKNPWELLVAVILSAQCTDIMVNKVTERLFMKYPDFNDYLSADSTVFEQDIKSTGFYRNKAKNILASAKRIKEQYGGNVPKTMEDLLTLPGVARKTANVVLGNAYGVVVGIAVDTHVFRLSQRLRLVDITKIGRGRHMVFQKDGKMIVDYTKDADPVKIKQELIRVIPKPFWFQVTYMLIDHGRAICKAQRPLCDSCMLSAKCPASRV